MASDLMLRSALAYAKLGYPVFPCGPDKRPYTSNGFKDAAVSSERIRAWWTRWPDAMIGVPTGATTGIVVLDLDLRAGFDGEATLAQLGLTPPPTWRADTPSGGQHFWFRHPGGAVRCSAGKIGPGVDVRGDGGYVVAPPSWNASGQYAWRAAGHPKVAPLAPTPPWLTAQGGAAERSPVDWAAFARAPVPAGRRNAALASLAGILFCLGVEPLLAVALLEGFNLLRCQPPLDSDEVWRIADSVALCEARKRGKA